MTAISATFQKLTPQPDREAMSSGSEADSANPSTTGARGGFADALRSASGRPARSSRDTEARKAAEPDDETARQGETAQAVPRAADPADVAAALATILSTVTSAAPPAAAAGGTVGSEAADGAPGLRATASAPASTGGSPAQGVTSSGAAGPAGTPPGGLSKVSVLESATHFAPVLAGAASPEPAVSALAPSAPGPAGAGATGAHPVQAGLRDLIGAELQPGQGGLAKSAAGATPSPPAPDLASASARAAGSGLDKADLTALSDIRAVTGIARAGLGVAGNPKGTEISTPEGSAGAAPALPANALPTIAAAIRDELARATAPEAAARAPQADPTLRTVPDGPLRVLRIQLRPEDLGTVTVELRLANGQLETHLRASQPETAALLRRDAAILTDLLKQANYQAEVTVGQARPSDTGGSSGGSASQGQPGFSDGGARPGQGGDRQRQAERNPAAGRREGERGDETIRPRDGSVYL